MEEKQLAVISSLVILFVLLLLGCQSTTSLVCTKPYILDGTDCCLDQNDNSICDSEEEVVAEEPEPEPEIEPEPETEPEPEPEPEEQEVPEEEPLVEEELTEEPEEDVSTYVIIVNDFEFDPSRLTIRAGDTVQWKNNRTVTSNGVTMLVRAATSKGYFGFKSPNFYYNGTFEYTFDVEGKLVYVDAVLVQSGVTGEITINP